MTTPTNPKILYEIIRLLMFQVREETHSRQALIRALMREEAKAGLIPTDEEVNERINELQEVALKNLTKNIQGGSIQ